MKNNTQLPRKCSRKGCSTFLCDRFSPFYGYLCSSCYQEMINTFCDIDYFMETEKMEIEDIKRNRKRIIDDIFKIEGWKEC